MMLATHLRTDLVLVGVRSVSQLRRFESDEAVEVRIHLPVVSLSRLAPELEDLVVVRHCNCSFLTSHYQRSRRENSYLDFESAEEVTGDAPAC